VKKKPHPRRGKQRLRLERKKKGKKPRGDKKSRHPTRGPRSKKKENFKRSPAEKKPENGKSVKEGLLQPAKKKHGKGDQEITTPAEEKTLRTDPGAYQQKTCT